MRPLNILTWHVHGSYLSYLSQIPHRLYLPVKPGRPEGYGGRLPGLRWPASVVEVPADEVCNCDLDCVLFQSRRNYEQDQFDLLSPNQRLLPRLFLEHDPPREHPTDTRHPAADDENVLIVHVTAFNELMWDNGQAPTRVIDHGIHLPEAARYTGELARGIAVVNGISTRGRRLGADVLATVREQVPVDLVGMGSERAGGLGEIGHDELPALMARYRFFFNPIRYTSLGLAVCEAMTIGLPVVGLATTEMTTVVKNGVNGYVDTRVHWLIEKMQALLREPAEAERMSREARRLAQQRFGIERFVHDWNRVLEEWTRSRTPQTAPPAATAGAHG